MTEAPTPDPALRDLLARGVPWWLAREAVATTRLDREPPPDDDQP